MPVILGAVRVKTRSSTPLTKPVPQSDHVTAAGVFESIYSPGTTLGVYEKAETIRYTTKRRSQRFLSNWCHHLRESTMYSGEPTDPVRLTFTGAGHVGHYCDYYRQHDHGKLAHTLAVGAAYGPTQLNVNTANPIYYGNPLADINLYYHELKPDLTVISLPNFFLELDDVQKLFKVWKKNLGAAKNVAGAHLNYSFGWKPLFSDIREMVGLLQGLQQKIEDFEKAANEVMKSRKTFFKELTAKNGTLTYGGQHTCAWSGFIQRSKTAGLCYRPQPFQVTRGYKMMLRAYLDALGFELNPRIIWDALPFTFVLDWFFDIGSWIERHKYDTLELPFLHVDSYVQYKEDVKVTSDLKMVNLPASNTQPPNFTVPYWATARTFYTRVPIRPDEQTFIAAGWKLPTANQAILGASLATVLARS